ncbi:MAG: hypothetical protein IT292_10370 [Deltaproteobacteria bacterium]|nr:hypothetical protein [Deltaproteobacteria bacterium]
MNHAGKHLSFQPIYLVLLPLLLLNACSATVAPKSYSFDTPRFILSVGKEDSLDKTLSVDPVFVQSANSILGGVSEQVQRIIGYEPKQKVVLRLLGSKDFTAHTGAPDWTSAMYFRGEIIIPYKKNKASQSDLQRALRHEYTHAVIAELSNYRCPAWLDEGLAQLIEGQPNQLLGPSLREWIKTNDSLPLDWLISGFTMLNEELVPVAYGQSLLIVRHLVNTYGMTGIRDFLRQLSRDNTEEFAFASAFNKNRDDFDKSLTALIRAWARSNQKHP